MTTSKDGGGLSQVHRESATLTPNDHCHFQSGVQISLLKKAGNKTIASEANDWPLVPRAN